MSWSEIKPILKTKTKTKPKSKKKNPDFHLEESLYANKIFGFKHVKFLSRIFDFSNRIPKPPSYSLSYSSKTFDWIL